MEAKSAKLLKTVKWWLPGAGGGGGGETVEMFQGTHVQLINNFWRANAQRSDYSQRYSIINFKVAKRLDLNSSYHKKETIIM